MLTQEDLGNMKFLLDRQQERIEKRFDRVEERVDKMEEHLVRVEEHLHKAGESLAKVKEYFNQVESDLKALSSYTHKKFAWVENDMMLMAENYVCSMWNAGGRMKRFSVNWHILIR